MVFILLHCLKMCPVKIKVPLESLHFIMTIFKNAKFHKDPIQNVGIVVLNYKLQYY